MANRKKLKKDARFVGLANGEQYFPGVKMTLWPNGEGGEIWFGDDKHRTGFKIRVGVGASGLAITVGRFAGSAPLTTTGNQYRTYDVLPQVEMDEVTICSYFGDDKSQAFKRWYGLDHLYDTASPTPEQKAAYSAGEAAAEAKIENPELPADPILKNAFERGYWYILSRRE